MKLGDFRVLNVAQVVAAMAVGALVPVTAVLVAELIRRQRSPARNGYVAPPSSSQRVEAVAQFAAAQFELLERVADGEEEHSRALDDGAAEAHSRGHLTLLPTSRADCPSTEKRSPGHGSYPLQCTGHQADVLRQPSWSLTRD